MRVLLVSHRYPPMSLSGVERCTQLLANALAAGGDEVAVLTRLPTLPQRAPTLRRERGAGGERVFRLVGGDAGLGSFLDHHRPLERLIAGVLDDVGPDLVHVHHLKDLSPGLVNLAHQRGAAVVMTLHDFYLACQMVHLRTRSGSACAGPDGGRACATTCFAADAVALARWSARTAYFRWLLSRVERVICPSRYVAGFFADFSRRPDRLRVIPNGLVMPLPSAVAEPSERPAGRELVLGFLGSVVDYKGLHVVLESLRLARLPAVELLVLGQVMDPDYARRLRALATTTAGLTVRWFGAYEPADLPLLLPQVDAVVLPSLVAESFSLTAREALALGIPVVASDIGALPEAVVDGDNGLLFSPGAAPALASLLYRLAHEPDLLPRLRAGASRTKVLSAADHTQAVRSVYVEALAERQRQVPDGWGEEQEGQALFEALLTLGFDTIAPGRRGR